MTYDQLYEQILNYIYLPYPVITGEITNYTGKPLLQDRRRACLILGAVMEFILDCQDEGVDLNKIDITDLVLQKKNLMGLKKNDSN